MIQLTEPHFIKLSEVTGVSHHDLQKLYSMGLLNESIVLDNIIRHDVAKARKTDRYRPGQIVVRVAHEYQVSANRVRSAMYRKQQRYHYCTNCDKRIPKSMYDRNDGLCDNCVAMSIEL